MGLVQLGIVTLRYKNTILEDTIARLSNQSELYTRMQEIILVY
jgi:hypothetical protein